MSLDNYSSSRCGGDTSRKTEDIYDIDCEFTPQTSALSNTQWRDVLKFDSPHQGKQERAHPYYEGIG
ncbi:hypothetical protein TNCV_4031061 [Trichonephila clavipes]|nr:hypothetical protein TNCV_4031061 [Trichonephila clavipes]